ncbi:MULTISPECIES: RNA polymerase sigma factor [Actinomadura]|uniref:RNA polymerase sigma factor n=1 Tax=Actinomadura yumaensis TaxID=111807 RepID=A0ABW2CKC8_9ACTN|nr:RNA polymerase sigma factor [Actinomadura sp. J1-007]MWK36901.1 sigma-70 family RNA polymerase sigma factor [Actinomadura sp. J1-007]
MPHTARKVPPRDPPAPPHDLDDASVIVWSLREPERFAALFRRHAPAIMRYVVRRLGPGPADDIVAETFLVAFRARASYDTARGDARAWLYGIATNLVRRHRRDEVRQLRALARTGADPVTESFSDAADTRLSAGAARRALAAALARLPAAQRDVLLLVAWEGLTYDEAGRALGVPAGTVRSRMNRARGKLRGALGGIDPTAVTEEQADE